MGNIAQVEGFFILLYILLCISVNAIQDTVTLDNKINLLLESMNESHNSYTCKRNKSAAWCIPLDFHRTDEPWKYRHITNTSMPWKYHFTFNILDVKEVNDKMQTITIMMYLRIKWMEPRLKINESASYWSERRLGTPEISPDILQYLWYPDLEIYGIERFQSKNVLKEMASVQIYKTNHIKYNARVDTTISCQMNFDRYPLDSHTCPFRIGSYYGTEEMVACTSEYGYNEKEQRSLQYSIVIDTLPSKYRRWSTRKNYIYATCGFNIILRRTRTQIFFQVYLSRSL